MRPDRYAVVAATLVASSLAGADTSTLVGLEIPPLSAGCKSQESMVLGASHAFAYERLLCDGREVVVLQRFVERRGKKAYWKVVDELHLPLLKPGVAALEVPLCRSRAHKDDAVFAIGKWQKAKDGSFEAKDITQAWRFNLQSGRIEAISINGVSCHGDDPE